MARNYDVTTIMITAKIKAYVINILVANKITIVNTKIGSLSPFVDGVPGYYRTVNGPYIKYVELTTVCPSFKDKVVVYPTEDYSIIFGKMRKKVGQLVGDESNLPMDMIKTDSLPPRVVDRFGYVYMTPDLLEKSQKLGFGLHPSLMPHNGRIIITSSSEKTCDPRLLIERMATSNAYRNAYPYNKIPFHVIDKCSNMLLVDENLKLPRTRTPKVVKDQIVFEDDGPEPKYEGVDMEVIVTNDSLREIEKENERKATYWEKTPAFIYAEAIKLFKTDSDFYANYMRNSDHPVITTIRAILTSKNITFQKYFSEQMFGFFSGMSVRAPPQIILNNSDQRGDQIILPLSQSLPQPQVAVAPPKVSSSEVVDTADNTSELEGIDLDFDLE